ncbi:MAG: hypothetical protein RRY38_02780, partial [Oscillospiraceae bacterium]
MLNASCDTVTLDFACAASAVWSILTDRSSYGEWYGYPRMLTLDTVEPAFAAGAKLRFRGSRGTSVVTVFEQGTKFAISSSAESNEFIISETENGCRVSLTTSLAGDIDWSGTAKARARANRDVLRRLRRLACSSGETEAEPLPVPTMAEERDGTLIGVFSGMFHGYKSPIIRRRSAARNSLDFSAIIDNTESDIVIHLNAAIAGFIMCALLFTTLFFAVRFPLSDIVPSSGLSVYASANVDMTHAKLISIGQTKDKLERMLSCAGVRLAPDQYVYRSSDSLYELSDDRRIFVVYDAYGCVRRFAYIDYKLALEPLSVPISNVRTRLSATMTVEIAENTVGTKAASFMKDKNGVTLIHFGKIDTSRSVFDTLPIAQLEVTLDSATKTADAQFYFAVDPNNPLPNKLYTEKLMRQYTIANYYLADRAAYERIFLLLGKTHQQVDAVLVTEGVDYVLAANNSVICSYSCRNPVADEAQYRYRYSVTFDATDVAYTVTLRNRWLERRENVLLPREDYSIREGMTLYSLYSELGILPTSAYFDADV